MWLVSFEINGRLKKACPPPDHTHTYIRSKYSTWANTTTDLEIYKRVWTHSWVYRLPPIRPTQADFPPSFPLLSADRSPFLLYQCDSRRSFCFWDHGVRLLLGVSVVSSRLLLLKKYTERHDDAAAGHPGTLPLTWRWETNSSSIWHL